jgi:hypothetical protein
MNITSTIKQKKRKKELKLMMVITKFVFLMNDELCERNNGDDELKNKTPIK